MSQTLSELRETLEKARRVHARREAEYEVARKGYDEALQALADEFNVSGPEEAETMLGRLRDLLEKKVLLLESYVERLEA